MMGTCHLLACERLVDLRSAPFPFPAIRRQLGGITSTLGRRCQIVQPPAGMLRGSRVVISRVVSMVIILLTLLTTAREPPSGLSFRCEISEMPNSILQVCSQSCRSGDLLLARFGYLGRRRMYAIELRPLRTLLGTFQFPPRSHSETIPKLHGSSLTTDCYLAACSLYSPLHTADSGNPNRSASPCALSTALLTVP